MKGRVSKNITYMSFTDFPQQLENYYRYAKYVLLTFFQNNLQIAFYGI